MSFVLVILALVGSAAASERFETYDFYLGDLHVHTGASGDGGSTDIGSCEGECGALADIAAIARDNGLDFMAVTDHVNGSNAMSDESWSRVMDATLGAADPGNGFVTILGGEVWAQTRGGVDFGHKTLLMFGEDADIQALSMTDVQPLGDERITLEACDDLWDWAGVLESKAGGVLLIAHHPATKAPMATSWDCHDEYHAPAVEIYSRHGNSDLPNTLYDPPWSGTVDEGTAGAALDPGQYGLKLGFVGGTDSHDTEPGAVCERDSEHLNHPYGGGLTIAVLPGGATFDRPAIYDAIVGRRTYTTSGPLVPVLVEYSTGGARLGSMGEVVGVPAGQPVDVELRIPAQWEGTVLQVQLVTPTHVEALVGVGDGTWRTSIPATELDAWVYPEIILDGSWYDECDDGGANAEEHIWVSPTWFELADPDLDGDGVAWLDGDCHDGDPEIRPGACERCDDGGVDEDCDGMADDMDPDCAETVGDTGRMEIGVDFGFHASRPLGSDTLVRPTDVSPRGCATTGLQPGPWALGLLALARRRRR